MAPIATKTESTFWIEYGVDVVIRATPEAIWKRLTTASKIPSWNTTVTSIEGDIVRGARLQIRVPLAPGRTFKPRVTELEPDKRMVWRDGRAPMFSGARTFTLTQETAGTTRFTMVEVLRGLMLPMIRKSLPDFRESFARYAADLAAACEASP